MTASTSPSTKVLLTALGGVALGSFLSGRAATPGAAPQGKDEIAYQARLLDDQGNAVDDPSLQVTFRVYEFAVGGTSLYDETDVVNVQDGLVSTYVGPLPAALLASSADLYLGVEYGTDGEMTPRLLLGSVPFALKAKEATVPAGMVMMTAASTPPAGFLSCDGSAVSRATYFDLFAAIGTTYGPGDGATTFNLPDLRQRFPLGKADAGTGALLGESGGAIDHTHASAAHSHQVNSHTHTMAHTHTTGTPSSVGFNFWIQSGGVGTPALGDHTHTTGGSSAGSTGGASPMTNSVAPSPTGAANPPYQVLNFVIKH